MTTEKIREMVADTFRHSQGDIHTYDAIGKAEIIAFRLNNYWKEKTRWIPVEEKLPELRENPFWVVAKNDKGDDYVIVNIRNEGFFEYLKSYFTHWKEIEL